MKTNAWRHAALAFGMALAGGTLVVACGPFSGPAAGDGTHEQRGFPFSGGTLTIAVTDADLAVEPGAGGMIAADRWHTGPASPSWSLRESTLTLGSTCAGAIAVDCGTSYEVKVPSGVAVVVRSDRGDLTASGLTQALTLTARHGDVHVDGSSGALDLTTGSGDLTVTRARSPEVTATTANGDASLIFAIPPATVRATTAGGSLHVTLPRVPATYRIAAAATHGTLTSAFPTDPTSPHSITAHTTNGDIRITRSP